MFITARYARDDKRLSVMLFHEIGKGKGMGDTAINYEELGFGFHTFRKEICVELGEAIL